MKKKLLCQFLFLCLFLLLIIDNSFIDIEKNDFNNKIISKDEYSAYNIYPINEIFIHKIESNTVLIFEPFKYHYECTPGYSKYFIDLGYKVDIIMNEIGITSLCIFDNIKKIRLFIYQDIVEIKRFLEFYSFAFNNYLYILIETTEPKEFKLYKNLNLLDIKNSFFVFHHLDYSYSQNFCNLMKNRLWTLGNFSLGIQINPHYFGTIKPRKKKNKLTKFFITSTKNRNYQFLISAAEKIKDDNLKFHVTVVGKWKTFSENDLSYKIKNNFSFKYKVSYTELYKEVYDSDYIIINLDPENKEDEEFKNIRVTGSAQLSYGFVKPVLINKNFANIYKFNSNNSFLYENENFFNVMKDAINQQNKDYRIMQDNLYLLSTYIYNNSLHNVKNCLKKL